jgi:hypothetical protein
VPEGHSFACEGEAAVEGTSETRSHAIGQYRIREPSYGKAGVTRSAFIAASAAGLLRSTSVNCATAAGTVARSCFQHKCCQLLSMPFDLVRLIFNAWLA